MKLYRFFGLMLVGLALGGLSACDSGPSESEIEAAIEHAIEKQNQLTGGFGKVEFVDVVIGDIKRVSGSNDLWQADFSGKQKMTLLGQKIDQQIDNVVRVREVNGNWVLSE